MKLTKLATAAVALFGASFVMAAEVPSNSDELFEFLTNKGYADFPAEVGTHKGEGPHLRRGRPVRVFYSPELAESIQSGAKSHPVGSAAIKEMYVGEGELQGWTVGVKVDPDSNNGKNWYWYEVLVEGRALADGQGLGVCVGCHRRGNDFVLSDLPFE